MNQIYSFTIYILYFQVDEMQHLKYSLIFLIHLAHLLPSFKGNGENK